jgi:hypothetical protein
MENWKTRYSSDVIYICNFSGIFMGNSKWFKNLIANIVVVPSLGCLFQFIFGPANINDFNTRTAK